MSASPWVASDSSATSLPVSKSFKCADASRPKHSTVLRGSTDSGALIPKRRTREVLPPSSTSIVSPSTTLAILYGVLVVVAAGGVIVGETSDVRGTSDVVSVGGAVEKEESPLVLPTVMKRMVTTATKKVRILILRR